MTALVASIAALFVGLLFSLAPFARKERWRATVTPLASIIGSGFLICGPILARQFGSGAIAAMAILLVLAYVVGWVVRFNIIHVENHAKTLAFHEPFAWAMRVTQATLSVAYAVSVAYYLKLLAEFVLRPIGVAAASQALISNVLVTAIIVALTALTFSGSIRKIEHAAHATVSIKLALIAGLLAGLGWWWGAHASGSTPLPAAQFSWHSVPVLLGLLITVQGFETSRYLGDTYDQHTRVQTMRQAQWLSSAIYLSFLLLLTPLLDRAQSVEGVAGILDLMKFVAPLLGVFVLGAAFMSQLSAAIADSIGAGGLMVEVSRRRLTIRTAFIASSLLSIAVVWLTDPFQVIALSSRAFAAFYAQQCALALWVSVRTNAGGRVKQFGFVTIGLLCLIATVMGAPAES
ncbi:MAG: hypothetical protein ABJB66_05275 [Gemmatimonadaceae bacterium]